MGRISLVLMVLTEVLPEQKSWDTGEEVLNDFNAA